MQLYYSSILNFKTDSNKSVPNEVDVLCKVNYFSSSPYRNMTKSNGSCDICTHYCRGTQVKVVILSDTLKRMAEFFVGQEQFDIACLFIQHDGTLYMCMKLVLLKHVTQE